MEITILQVVAALFSLFALSRVFLRYRQRSLTGKEALFWSFIWVLVAVIVLVPATTEVFSRWLGAGTDRPIDALVYLSIIALFYLLYRVNVKQEELDHKLTRIVRELSIHETESEKRKKKDNTK